MYGGHCSSMAGDPNDYYWHTAGGGSWRRVLVQVASKIERKIFRALVPDGESPGRRKKQTGRETLTLDCTPIVGVLTYTLKKCD